MVQSVTRALCILEALAESQDDLGVSDLSRHLGLSKSTVHRLLMALQARGYVQSDVQGKYALGLKSFEIGSAVLNRMGLRKIAFEPMQELGQITRETINLALLDGIEIVYIDRIESSEPLKMDLQVGRRVPATCSALGKALVAFVEPSHLEEILSKVTLEKYTEKTIDNLEDLHQEFARIRMRGYSLDDEEYIEGIRCIAAPVFDYRGNPVAAISVAGPSLRLTLDRVEQVAELVVKATLRVSSCLGYRDDTRRSGVSKG